METNVSKEMESSIEAKSSRNKFLSHPVSRIVLGLLVCVLAFIIGQTLISKVLHVLDVDKNLRNLLKGIVSSILVISAYKMFFKYVEKREITEISLQNFGRNLFLGLFIGVLLQSLTILVIYSSGGFTILSVNPLSHIIIPFTVAFTVAIFEEIIIRGILFRILEEKLGSYIALSISAIVFGALHLSNPNSSLLSALCIAIEAGILLGASYIYTRNLWFPIAIHFAWNFMQSGIFGAITSGNEKTESLLKTKLEGATMITGGEFGPEGTIQAIIFCGITGLILLYLCKKNNLLFQPSWKRV